jgi:hypothetical protein
MARKPSRKAYLRLDDLRGDRTLAQALGDMIVAWSNAEYALLETLQTISSLSWDSAHTLYFRMPTFESRVKVIQAMLDQWTPPPVPDPDDIVQDPKEISRIVGKLSSLSTTRNGWVHASWFFSANEGAIFVVDYRERHNSPTRRKPIKAADVKNHIEAVHEWTGKLKFRIRPILLGPRRPARQREWP